MISASHNPYQDNGIKLFNSQGYKLSDKVEYEIEKLLYKGPTLTNAKNLGRARRMEDAIGRYIELIKLILKKEENLLGMKIVLDCANGAVIKLELKHYLNLVVKLFQYIKIQMELISMKIVELCFLMKWL